MEKFVRVHMEVKAVRFSGDYHVLCAQMTEAWGASVVESCVENLIVPNVSPDPVVHIRVETNHAWLAIEPGDWVVRDGIGFYPCKDEIFRKKYRPTDEVADEALSQNKE